VRGDHSVESDYDFLIVAAGSRAATRRRVAAIENSILLRKLWRICQKLLSHTEPIYENGIQLKDMLRLAVDF
jgi:predicted nucleotidyltransferase